MSLYRITPKLCKLLPRLASNHSGEVVATVAAIDRTLRGADCDWHDLANHIGRRSNGISAPPPLLAMAEALDGLPALNSWETKFVADMRQLLAAGARLTEKQEQALRRTYARHGGKDAA